VNRRLPALLALALLYPFRRTKRGRALANQILLWWLAPSLRALGWQSQGSSSAGSRAQILWFSRRK
jgi:hypothetical protein